LIPEKHARGSISSPKTRRPLFPDRDGQRITGRNLGIRCLGGQARRDLRGRHSPLLSIRARKANSTVLAITLANDRGGLASSCAEMIPSLLPFQARRQCAPTAPEAAALVRGG